MVARTYPETNQQDTLNFGALEAKSIDYTSRFGQNFSKFVEALGITRQIPVQDGFTIKLYGAPDVDLADGNVAEGDLIPLSKVTPVAVDTKEIKLKKYRKVTTMESIQKYGANEAINITDDALIKEVQKNIRTDLFTTIKAGQAKDNLRAGTLQGALATAWGQLETVFEDDAVRVVAFVHPLDVAQANADKELTLETQFGLNYYETATGTVVFTSTQIERGTIYATAAENLQVAYIASNSEAYRAFNMTTDQFGYIGMVHDTTAEALVVQTVLASGVAMFPERLDGVIKIAIGEAEVTPEG